MLGGGAEEGPAFAIVAKAHLGLPKTNRVFALGDAIELLEMLLVHALAQRSTAVPRYFAIAAAHLAGEV